MWLSDFLWGVLHGVIGWPVLLIHVFGGWESHRLYDITRSGNWYDFGFLLGMGSPILGIFGRRAAAAKKD
jgi:hypothetical protein